MSHIHRHQVSSEETKKVVTYHHHPVQTPVVRKVTLIIIGAVIIGLGALNTLLLVNLIFHLF